MMSVCSRIVVMKWKRTSDPCGTLFPRISAFLIICERRTLGQSRNLELAADAQMPLDPEARSRRALHSRLQHINCLMTSSVDVLEFIGVTKRVEGTARLHKQNTLGTERRAQGAG